jgi:hypothetical protein
LVKCYTLKKNKEGEVEENKSHLEEVLKKDAFAEAKPSEATTKITNQKFMSKEPTEMMMFNNELDDAHVEMIKNSLTNHFMFKDLDENVLYVNNYLIL